MTMAKRLEKLEKRTGGRGDEQVTIMVLYYGGDRKPTEEEKAAAIARHPERTMAILQWNGQCFESAIP